MQSGVTSALKKIEEEKARVVWEVGSTEEDEKYEQVEAPRNMILMNQT